MLNACVEVWVNYIPQIYGIAAALLASRLAGMVAPVTAAQEASLAPDRFAARQARRGPWRGQRSSREP